LANDIVNCGFNNDVANVDVGDTVSPDCDEVHAV